MVEGDEFSVTKLENEIYRVREKFYTSWNVANIWVVKGSSKDLIIDTGIGLWDLPGFLKSHGIIGDKPFEALATHIHFDHSGGAHQFEKFAIHRMEADAMRTGEQMEMCSHMTAKEVGKPPSPGWNARDYKVPAKQPTRILDDGDVFDLGNRKLKVMHLPGHTRGSIALYEEESQTLFTGDIAYVGGPILDMLPYSNVSDYRETAETLKALAPNVRSVYAGHGEVFDGKALDKVLSDYITSKQACCSGTKTACAGVLVDFALLRGRNSNNLAANCCYHCCCCYYCVQNAFAAPANGNETENTGLLPSE